MDVSAIAVTGASGLVGQRLLPLLVDHPDVTRVVALDVREPGWRSRNLDFQRVDIAGMCRTAADALRARAEEKGQKLEVALDPSAGSVIGDARRLRESVEHILRNAVAYTEDGGHVWLKASGDEERAEITIVDDGPGIAADDQAQVFTRFHRSGATRERASPTTA